MQSEDSVHRLIQVMGLVLLLALGAPTAARSSDVVLDERVLGADDAPVTMIEFSSLTCPHCAEFHTETLPKIKEQYVTPGKVRLVYRDFPLDPLAMAAAMLPHCAGSERYFGLLEALFRSQATWARSPEPAKELERLSRFAGLSPTAFQECLNNQELLQAIQQRAEAARGEYNITSTPTFVINSQKIVGARSFEEFQKVIEQQLASEGEPEPASVPGDDSSSAAEKDSVAAEAGWLARQWDRVRSWWNGAQPG
jgi:protein-disulfide isomerase